MGKIHIAAVEKTISGSIIETFQTMLSMDLVKAGEVTDAGLDEDRLVGAVHYAGEVTGTLSIQTSRAFARLITSAMLGVAEADRAGEEEIKDVLGELTNIVSGNLKSDFLGAGLACLISTPAIIQGSAFEIAPGRLEPVAEWVFRHTPPGCKSHELIIQTSLKEDIGAGREIENIDRLPCDDLRQKVRSVDVPAEVINSVIDVFFTMLSMEATRIADVPAGVAEEKRTVGMVSFAGDVQGIFIIQVNDRFARAMTAALRGISEDEIGSEEEVLDVIRDVTNIIGGNLTSRFADAGLACVLSRPSITRGIDFRVEALNIIRMQRFLFAAQGNTVIVEAGINREEFLKGRADDALPAAPPAQQTETAPGDAEELRNFKLALEIPLELTVELGRAKRRIADILKLGTGSILELEQLEGEPVDILINDMLIAKGEVMVEKEKYGIRIVQIVSHKKRAKSLR